jgi:uncharacterized protein (DUF736 family)
MAETPTSTTENTEFDNSNEAGAVWIGEDKKGGEKLSIKLGDRMVYGFPNQKKTDAEGDVKKPDYNIIEFAGEESSLVGAAWVGKTANDRDKLTIKVGEQYYTAVMREVKEGQSDKRADMTIFAPSAAPAETK